LPFHSPLLGQSDVLRHSLVKKIIDAFDKTEQAEKKRREEEADSEKQKNA